MKSLVLIKLISQMKKILCYLGELMFIMLLCMHECFCVLQVLCRWNWWRLGQNKLRKNQFWILNLHKSLFIYLLFLFNRLCLVVWSVFQMIYSLNQPDNIVLKLFFLLTLMPFVCASRSNEGNLKKASY